MRSYSNPLETSTYRIAEVLTLFTCVTQVNRLSSNHPKWAAQHRLAVSTPSAVMSVAGPNVSARPTTLAIPTVLVDLSACSTRTARVTEVAFETVVRILASMPAVRFAVIFFRVSPDEDNYLIRYCCRIERRM